MGDKDIRWKQRFGNYQDALEFLKESVAKGDHTELEKAGVVQSFEFTFELAWKTMKDYLNEKGIDAIYPRDVIKEAFKNGLVNDGDRWLDMLGSRNLMSHTYKSADSEFVYSEIVSIYVKALDDLFETLKNNL
jgi:nucleotidyltransferase substrate binding protein (TIGR01987 family)